MLKKQLALFMVCFMCSSFIPTEKVQAATFKDVPSGHWAYSDIEKASSLDIIKGLGSGIFGMGQEVNRAEFASYLTRMFQWNKVNPQTPSFSDTNKSKWYYSDVETALKNGVIQIDGQSFRPEDSITREEMAVMLIRAFGYDSLADSVNDMNSPFNDVAENKGYITMAYDFGIVSGKANMKFDPKGTATREEAAAILMRAYDKSNLGIDYLHGFYAFSSYTQKEMAAEMDAVSYGWSRMDYIPGSGVQLNVTAQNNNEWKIPTGYEGITNYLKQNKVQQNLNIFMSATTMITLEDGSKDNICNIVLTNSENRKSAVKAIINELTRIYETAGYNPYSGVTIDFENLKGSQLKSGFSLFLTELNEELDKIDKKLYVAVQPQMKNSAYYDGYDYYTIGQLADKVILMAHDYQANSIGTEVMQSGFTTTPVSPFDEVYYGLKAITDGNTGIQDKSKIVLGISINSVGWSKKGGIITNSLAFKPSMSEINQKIKEGAIVNYSSKYRNPYVVYQQNGEEMTVWYENSKSIEDKVKLAGMFGVDGLSIWRIGNIPDYEKTSDLDIWSTIKSLRK